MGARCEKATKKQWFLNLVKKEPEGLQRLNGSEGWVKCFLDFVLWEDK
jgi:hypothetical protein